MPILTLDHIDRIEIDPDTFPVANLHALGYMPRGLHLLAHMTRHHEREVLHHHRGIVLWAMGPPAADLITNWFTWFSISLSSYLRLVRLVGLMKEHGWGTADLLPNRELIKTTCVDYVQRVAPEIYLWRNKVAAHPAFTDPFKADSLGTLELSVMNPVAFRAPYYRTGTIRWSTGGHDSALAEWALTEVFEQLAPRLWPQLALQPLE